MKINTPQEHYGEREQREAVGRRAAETEWNHTTRTITGPRTRTDHPGNAAPADREDAVDRAHSVATSPLRIDSILPNLASPGHSVIIQGSDLGTATKVLFGDQEALFEVDGETLVVHVPDGAGAVEVTIEGSDGQRDIVNFTIT
jgi:hypothetical protein